MIIDGSFDLFLPPLVALSTTSRSSSSEIRNGISCSRHICTTAAAAFCLLFLLCSMRCQWRFLWFSRLISFLYTTHFDSIYTINISTQQDNNGAILLQTFENNSIPPPSSTFAPFPLVLSATMTRGEHETRTIARRCHDSGEQKRRAQIISVCLKDSEETTVGQLNDDFVSLQLTSLSSVYYLLITASNVSLRFGASPSRVVSCKKK